MESRFEKISCTEFSTRKRRHLGPSALRRGPFLEPVVVDIGYRKKAPNGRGLLGIVPAEQLWLAGPVPAADARHLESTDGTEPLV